MKPYTLLEECTSSAGHRHSLYERDTVRYYQVDSLPVANTKEFNCEEELATTLSSPFHPAKQPKFLIIGLGIGGFLTALGSAMPKEKAKFEILDSNPSVLAWYEKHLMKNPDVLPRSELNVAPYKDFLKTKSEYYNSIFIDPELWRSYEPTDDPFNKLYINHVVGALKKGGLIGMITERPDKLVVGRMERSGLEVRTEMVPAVRGGKRQRIVWVAKKGHYVK